MRAARGPVRARGPACASCGCSCSVAVAAVAAVPVAGGYGGAKACGAVRWLRGCGCGCGCAAVAAAATATATAAAAAVAAAAAAAPVCCMLYAMALPALACSGLRDACGHVRARAMRGILWACQLGPGALALSCAAKSMMEKSTRESSSSWFLVVIGGVSDLRARK